MQHLVAQSTHFIGGMSARTRIAVVVGLLLLVGAAAGLAFFFHDSGTPLFARPLDGAQQAEIQQRLTGWDIPFRLSTDNVIVEPGRKRDVLLRLAMVGVPHIHLTTSADVLKSVSALTPQSVLDAQVREGLEGDLAEGLRGIAGVSDARVLIAPATRGFFVDEPSHDASASVRISLDAGTTLAPEAVNGIRTYVAGAVAGLGPDRVAIMDQNGVALGTRSGGADAGEDRPLETTLQAALDRTIGVGKTIVIARIETDPSVTSVHEVKRTPVAVASLATDVTRERYHGKDKQYEKMHETTDRGSDTFERNTHFDAGRTSRRSVAVFLDRRETRALAQVKDVVSAAAGIVPARGDTLSVVPLQFDAAPPIVAAGPAARPFAVASLGASLPILLLAFALAGAAVLIYRALAPTVRAQSDAAALTEKQAVVADFAFDATRVHSALAGEPPHAAAAILSALPVATTAAVLELYEPDERRDIVRRLTNPIAPVVRDVSARVGGG